MNNWLATLLSPTGFLFHLIGIIALSVLLAVGMPSGSVYVGAEFAALLTLLGVSIGTGTQTIASTKAPTPPA
jgi:hypothetical protein